MIQANSKISFREDKLPFVVKGVSKRFAICTRELNRRNDADLIWHEVEMGAYCTFTEAYKHLKDTVIYTIVDFCKEIRGPHFLVFNVYDFNDADSIKACLDDLEKGELELSSRKRITLNIKL